MSENSTQFALQQIDNQSNHREDARRPPLVVILGPTAVGKTEISIQLAERFSGEIVSADSRLFYRGMDIGTAKPTPDEMRRVPHHLIDVTDPDQIWSLAVFQRQAQEVIADIHRRGKLPFLVGGTGQYVRAIMEGWRPPRAEPDPRLRKILQDWAKEIGREGLHARLAILDPRAAKKIDYRNLRRTVRALEVIFSTGRRFSDQRRQWKSPYQLLVLGLQRPREELYRRVDQRIQDMLEAGFVEEVRALLAHGYSPDLPTMSAIGYREIVAYLQGKISLEQAVERIRRATRVFVRRQANWFKPDDPNIHWFNVGPDVVEEIEITVQDWLERHFPAQYIN
jgi:tRNA dimethylallyltransferase